MEKYDIYKDIATRTGGDIYIGVVGPVRTGKSSFITSFMNKLVIPNITNKLQKQIATDEMPQSADGKTIMTTQPKFIPANAVKVTFKNKATASVRLVDCVGYFVEGASGNLENDKPRLVKTPWSDEQIPFDEAAEIGTKKVISEYSTICVLVTTDGSFTDIPRENYENGEERVVEELKASNKPFVIFLNCKDSTSDSALSLAQRLEEKYGVSVVCGNCLTLNNDNISEIMQKILFEFPMSSFDIELPKWMQALSIDSKIIGDLTKQVKESSMNVSKMRDFDNMINSFSNSDNFSQMSVKELKLGEGVPVYTLTPNESLFYNVLSDECDEVIEDDYKLMRYIRDFSKNKKQYNKIKQALRDAEQDGYGVVLPSLDEMNLEEPSLVKQGGRYGVKLKATAPSLHIVKVDVSTEVAPTVGTEKQGEDLVNSLMSNFEENPNEIWNTDMFGKPLHQLVNEGLTSKINCMPKDAQCKMRKTLTKMVNENRGGMICILL